MDDEQRKAVMARLNETGKLPGLPLLRALNSMRRPSAQVLDERRSHQRTGAADDPSFVRAWLKGPGRVDLLGVDDPDAEYRAMRKRRDAPLTGAVLGEDLVMLPVKAVGKRPRAMTEARRRHRDAGLEALRRDELEVAKEFAILFKKHNLTKAERERRDHLQRRLENLRRIKLAYRKGDFLVVAHKKDAKLAEAQARVLRTRFVLDPASMESAVLFVGTTSDPAVYGYTHEWSPDAGVPGDFIASNPKLAQGQHEADTLTHEAIHVLRKRESGRTMPETRGVKNYGEDRDIEEKYTVLEEQLRSAPPGTRKDDSYYSAFRNDPRAPVKIGAADNRIAQATPKARRERRLTAVQDAMHKRGTHTWIARLHRTKDSGWGAIPPDLEGIDRVFTTSDGEAVHVFNPKGKPIRRVQDFVRREVGHPGAKVYEYQDGRKKKLGRRAT